MTLNEIGFVIQRKDGSIVADKMRRRVGPVRWGRRTKVVHSSGTPWKSYAAAERANWKTERRNIDGKMRTVTENVGEVVMVKLMVL